MIKNSYIYSFVLLPLIIRSMWENERGRDLKKESIIDGVSTAKKNIKIEQSFMLNKNS